MSAFGLAESMMTVSFGAASVRPIGRAPLFLDQIMAFLHQLWDTWGPYLGPLYDALNTEYIQSLLLTTVVATVVFVSVMVFVLHEGEGMVRALLKGPSVVTGLSSSKESPPRRTQVSGRPSSAQTQTKSQSPTTAELESAGVAVHSTFVKDSEGYLLSVEVHNRMDQRIDMVVVDTDLPTGVDSRVGSFRMQRLGTIKAGESKTAKFGLVSTTGTLSGIRGYVEFMSASYEISRIEIPVPEIRE